MGWSGSLPHVLLMVAAVELAVYRIAVPGLKPVDPTESPPVWHTALSYAGLFLSYFGSVLAVGILLGHLILLARGEHPYWRPAGYALVVSAAAFAFYAVKSLITVPGEADTFLLELSFTTSLFLLVICQLRPGGDLASKLGLLLLAAPLFVHFYRDASVRWVLGDEALLTALPEQVAAYGQWTMVLAALLSPYCFAPRPFVESAGRLAPLAIGAFVGLVGALVMRQSAEVGVKLAYDGLGVDLGGGAPTSQIALYLIALGSITWTLVACFLSPSPARRRIGVGLGLVVAAGYGFDWPLQYLAGFIGSCTIAEALREVTGEEQSARAWATARFRTPPIAPEAWQRYVHALVEALRARGHQASAVSIEDHDAAGYTDSQVAKRSSRTPAGYTGEDAVPLQPPAPAFLRSGGPAAAPRSADGDTAGASLESVDPGSAAETKDPRVVVSLAAGGGRSRTHVLVVDPGVPPLRLLVERVAGAVQVLEVTAGGDGRTLGEAPSFTLEARRDRRIGAPAHPPPPASGAAVIRTGDPEFDRRFRVRDDGGQSQRLFDEGLRARAAALLDGWLALWPDRSLVYQVVPGHGAPLDNPIPISELAFRGEAAGGAVDRMISVLELLGQLGARGIGRPPDPESTHGSESTSG